MNISSKPNQNRLIKNILKNSFIGFNIEIISHTNQDFLGTYEIINETRNLLFVFDSNKKKKFWISKKDGKFNLIHNDVQFVVDGEKLLGLPRQRSKKKFRSW